MSHSIIHKDKIKNVVAKRDAKGRFIKGASGNPSGRPPGSVSTITWLRRSAEQKLRDKAYDDLSDILDKAIELAKAGNTAMIKLMLELHMSKAPQDPKETQEKVSIHIGEVKRDESVLVTHNDKEIINGSFTKQAAPDEGSNLDSNGSTPPLVGSQ